MAKVKPADDADQNDGQKKRKKKKSGGWWETIRTVIYAVLAAVILRTVALEPFN
ncbi:MAG: hypothetical protein HOK61_09420, partial [Alphaproteobacteria bacterium]|nr:hypothetical protein [Alphaproteobacteria bacterium]